jgi:retinol dehydrogenase-12
MSVHPGKQTAGATLLCFWILTRVVGCFHTSMTDHMPQTLANRMINVSYHFPSGAGLNSGLTFRQKIIFIYSPDYKAYTQLWAGTAPEAGKLHGKVRILIYPLGIPRTQFILTDSQYITPWNSVGNPRAETQDEGLMTELWTYLEGRVKAHELKQVEGA